VRSDFGAAAVLRGVHCGLGAARINDDDVRLVRIAQHALPHDRVRDARIGADENQHVAQLEIGVGERRRIEAERLLVGDVAVAMHWRVLESQCSAPMPNFHKQPSNAIPRCKSGRCSGTPHSPAHADP
jgi:hypothetical protein